MQRLPAPCKTARRFKRNKKKTNYSFVIKQPNFLSEAAEGVLIALLIAAVWIVLLENLDQVGIKVQRHM